MLSEIEWLAIEFGIFFGTIKKDMSAESKGIITEIIINKPPEVVRKAFLDFESYHQWNPFITSLELTHGDLADPVVTRAKLKASISPPGKSAMTFTPDVLINTEKEFKWVGSFLGLWFVAGYHYYKFEAVDNGTRFIQGEYFTGIASKLFLAIVGVDNTRKGFELMNEALKKKCES